MNSHMRHYLFITKLLTISMKKWILLKNGSFDLKNSCTIGSVVMIYIENRCKNECPLLGSLWYLMKIGAARRAVRGCRHWVPFAQERDCVYPIQIIFTALLMYLMLV